MTDGGWNNPWKLTKKHDERCRDAYAACMRSRGYTG
jgi:hypothetical protein